MKRVLILHAYSADNIGDGFLVDETVALLHEALGDGIEITLLAHRPESFADFPGKVLSSAPFLFLPNRHVFATLRSLAKYDLVVGVGGGYLRTGTILAAAKCALVHFPQLVLASRIGSRAVYLPQSIGPLGFGTRSPMRLVLKKLKTIMARDDRTVAELQIGNVRRYPDLALMRNAASKRESVVPTGNHVLSVRPVRGVMPRQLYSLADALRPFDGFVQSETGHNDDRAAMESLGPQLLLQPEDLYGSGPRRVVVAVRLHAALLAMGAGHYVIHLSYERKGYGAFQDLGLDDYVHNVFKFDPDAVCAQVKALANDASIRTDYDAQLNAAREGLLDRRREVVTVLRREVR